MALRVAVANGNWSNPSTWNGGVLPAAGDVVASNGYTVTIDQNVNVDSITNSVVSPFILTPQMTSNTTPSGIASSSSNYVGYDPWNAFARGANDWLTFNGNITGWLAYEFPIAKTVGKYVMVPPSNGSPTSVPRDWTFEGWTGSEWVVLDTVTGNSGTATVTRSIANITAYIKYRLNITANNGNGSYTGVSELYLYEANDYGANSVAGGTFILNSGVTVTCTNTGNGINIGTVTCLTYSGTGSVIINANIGGITANSITGFLISGAGNITINGTINASTTNGSTMINVNAAATLNINGNINGFSNSAGNANAVRMGVSGSVLNLVGNIEVRGTIKQTVSMQTGTTLNMTGNVLCQLSSANSGVGVEAIAATINITGDLSITNAGSASNVNWYCLSASNICTINIVGTIFNDTTSNAMALSYPVIISGASYFKHIGSAIGGLRAPAVINTNGSAINIFTGPFISHSSGIQPFYVNRMHYQRTIGSYFEFRDNSTNGALPPAGAAPATRLVSPDTVVDAPIPANVRFGTVYASGSQTGTMKVPAASNVRAGIEVDDTVGTAVLTASQIWEMLQSNLTTPGSIGERLKNCSTVQTTGSQIASL
jgi:hypothetical protein